MENFWDKESGTFEDVILHFFSSDAVDSCLKYIEDTKANFSLNDIYFTNKDDDLEVFSNRSFEDWFDKAVAENYNFRGCDADELFEGELLNGISCELTNFDTKEDIQNYLDECIEKCECDEDDFFDDDYEEDYFFDDCEDDL